jgi:hypothetical protein
MNKHTKRDENSTRDFIRGVFLVPAAHTAFSIGWLGISVVLILILPFFNHNYNFILLGIPYFFLAITQLLYLIPLYIHFVRQQRHEVCKGIILSATATLLINGACFARIGSLGIVGNAPQLLIAAIAILITIGIIGQILVQRYR